VSSQIAKAGLKATAPLEIPDLARLVEPPAGIDEDRVTAKSRELRRLNRAEFVYAGSPQLAKFAREFKLDLGDLAFDCQNVYKRTSSSRNRHHARPCTLEPTVLFTCFQDRHIEEILRVRAPNQLLVHSELSPLVPSPPEQVLQLRDLIDSGSPLKHVALHPILDRLRASGIALWWGGFQWNVPLDKLDPPLCFHRIHVGVIGLTDALSSAGPTLLVPPVVNGLGPDIDD
jgi:hypothetical protein